MFSFRPPDSRSGFRLATRTLVALLALCLAAGCATLSSAPTLTPIPRSLTSTLPSRQADNPTAAAFWRATRQAQFTLDSQATQGLLASQTALAQAALTATSDARATVQAIYTAEHTWPQRVAETFVDNQLGWPVGVTQDQFLAVTSTVAGGRYEWLTQIAMSGAYTNLAPAKGPTPADFYAAVTVQFAPGRGQRSGRRGLWAGLPPGRRGFWLLWHSEVRLVPGDREPWLERRSADTA